MTAWDLHTLPAGEGMQMKERAQLTGASSFVSVIGSDVHITAMWVRAPDDQPPACICSACLICCSPTRRDSLIDPDIHWTHITVSVHNTHAMTATLLEAFYSFMHGCVCWIITALLKKQQHRNNVDEVVPLGATAEQNSYSFFYFFSYQDKYNSVKVCKIHI